MPHHTDTIAVYYNKRMFRESGIRIPRNPEDGWTWDELTRSREIESGSSSRYAFGGIWENGSGYRFLLSCTPREVRSFRRTNRR
jgi:ABC-type glycerol-3-phosphate transport system substrate-binding protein